MAVRFGGNDSTLDSPTITGTITMDGSVGIPNTGDLYYSNSQKSFCVQEPMGTAYGMGLSKVLYSDFVGSAAIANTTTETNFAFQSSPTVLANSLTVGKKIEVTISGIVSDTLTPTLTLKFYLGSVQLLTTGAVTLGASLANQMFQMNVGFTVRELGSSGLVMPDGTVTIGGVLTPVAFEGVTAASTVNTTVDQIIKFSAQFSAANAANTITGNVLTVKVLG